MQAETSQRCFRRDVLLLLPVNWGAPGKNASLWIANLRRCFSQLTLGYGGYSYGVLGGNLLTKRLHLLRNQSSSAEFQYLNCDSAPVSAWAQGVPNASPPHAEAPDVGP